MAKGKKTARQRRERAKKRGLRERLATQKLSGKHIAKTAPSQEKFIGKHAATPSAKSAQEDALRAAESTGSQPSFARPLAIALVGLLAAAGVAMLVHFSGVAPSLSFMGSAFSSAELFGASRFAETGSAGEVLDSSESEFVEDNPDPLHEAHVQGEVSRSKSSEVAYCGRETFEDSEALERLQASISSIEGAGYTVGICLSDIEGDVQLSYKPDERVYSASAIKGPYVMFVAEKLIDTERSGEMRRNISACISNSDNEAYSSIRQVTRNMGWLDYLSETGLDLADRENEFDNHWYANMSARDFELLWQRGYPYLAAGEGAAEWVAPLFEHTLSSSISAVLSGSCQVWSKAGWHDGSGPRAAGTPQAPATNDAGVVFSETGPYVLAIVTNTPVDFQSLCELVDAANMCHQELSGSEITPLLTEDTPVPLY